MSSIHIDESLLAERFKNERPSLTRSRSNAISRHSHVPTSISYSSSEHSDIEDDFPTPRASELNQLLSSGYSQATSAHSTPLGVSTKQSFQVRDSAGTDLTYFEDSEYDELDEGAWFVPIKISPSIKKTLEQIQKNSARPLSIAIPHHKTNIKASRGIRRPVAPTPLSPDALAALGQGYKKRTKNSSIPSLDSTATTVEMASITAPSTPIELSSEDDEGEVWNCPIMLDPRALEMLNHISPDPNEFMSSPTSDSSNAPMRNMEERGLGIEQVFENLAHRSPVADEESRLSSITVPSPRGFFASLDPEAQEVWRSRHVSPTTAIAEAFYDVPWRNEQSPLAETPLTATIPQMHIDPEGLNSSDIPMEYDQDYQPKLLNESKANLDRTKVWLQTQEAWLEAKRHPEAARTKVVSLHIVDDLLNEGTLVDLAGLVGAVLPTTIEQTQADPVTELSEPIMPSELPTRSEPLLYHTFQQLLRSTRPLDPFLFQKTRADALETRRLYLSTAHLANLRGTFAMQSTTRPKSDSFQHLPASPNGGVLAARREAIAQAQKQRHMREQVETSVRYLEALRYLIGGTLLPSLAIKQINQKKSCGMKPRVLVLADQPCAGFGWAVAMEHRDAKVYTAVVKSDGNRANWLVHRGPSNHRTVMIASPWTLPFPDGAFDVVSARTLHMCLHKMEYEDSLKEIYRVLAPGGILHFSVTDAVPTSSAGTRLDEMVGTFVADLQDAGYDAQPTRHMLSRLRRAGFVGMKRMRLALPIGGGEGKDGVEDMAGMVGSVEWERWILKLQEEQGRTGDDLLKGVASALAEARRVAGDGTGSGGQAPAWKMLVGCARKSCVV